MSELRDDRGYSPAAGGGERRCAAALLCSGALAAALLAVGCDLKMTNQELRLVCDPSGGAAQLLLTYEGICAPDDRDATVEKARAIVERCAAGRRELYLLGLEAHFDLDDPNFLAGLDPLGHRVVAGMSLGDWGLYRDSEGRLCGFQLWRLENPPLLVEAINRLISKWVLAACDEDQRRTGPDGDEILDAETRRAWRESAQRQWQWVSLDGAEIVVEVPMTPASAERLRRSLIDDCTKPGGDSGEPFLLQVLLHLSEAETEHGRVLLRFAAPITGVYQLSFHDAEVSYGPRLLEALLDAGVEVDDALDRESVLGLLR